MKKLRSIVWRLCTNFGQQTLRFVITEFNPPRTLLLPLMTAMFKGFLLIKSNFQRPQNDIASLNFSLSMFSSSETITIVVSVNEKLCMLLQT